MNRFIGMFEKQFHHIILLQEIIEFKTDEDFFLFTGRRTLNSPFDILRLYLKMIC